MKIILGIDPGLATVGFGLIKHEGSRYIHLYHGMIQTSAGDDMGRRLVKIHDELKTVICNYKPHEAGVETLYFSKNVKSAMPVAQARGVILFTLAEALVPFSEYTPLQLKQAVVGRGRADKKQIQFMLKILFNLEEPPKPDHAADALAAAICQANYGSLSAGSLQTAAKD